MRMHNAERKGVDRRLRRDQTRRCGGERPALDEGGVELDVRDRGIRVLDATRDETGGLARHLGEVVGDRRQLDDRPRRGRQVVEADDRDLFGDGYSGPARGVQCAVRDHVVAAEDQGRRGGQGEERCRRLVARLRVERTAPHVLRVQREAVLGERRPEGDLAGLRGAGVARPENGADAPMTQGDGARGGRARTPPPARRRWRPRRRTRRCD